MHFSIPLMGIYIGVEDDGTIVGCANLDDTLKKIADVITMQIMPNPQEFVKVETILIDRKNPACYIWL